MKKHFVFEYEFSLPLLSIILQWLLYSLFKCSMYHVWFQTRKYKRRNVHSCWWSVVMRAYACGTLRAYSSYARVGCWVQQRSHGLHSLGKYKCSIDLWRMQLCTRCVPCVGWQWLLSLKTKTCGGTVCPFHVWQNVWQQNDIKSRFLL